MCAHSKTDLASLAPPRARFDSAGVRRQPTDNSSTSKMSVERGGITGG
jgi:hypothetical protein